VYAASVSYEGDVAHFVAIDHGIQGICKRKHAEIHGFAVFIEENGCPWSKAHIAEALRMPIYDIVVTVKHLSNYVFSRLYEQPGCFNRL
jgi:hypothetical protein